MSAGAVQNIPLILRVLYMTDLTCKTIAVDVPEDATTEKLIEYIATNSNITSKEKIVISLDYQLNVEGHCATWENAKEVDVKVREQFKSNIVNFITHYGTGGVLVKT